MIKNYENILNKITCDIKNNVFDFDKNEELIKKIIEIYKESRNKNFEIVKNLISSIENIDNNDNNIKTRDWNIDNIDEDNIESFNSIEMISGIFLDNLKNNLWQQK